MTSAPHNYQVYVDESYCDTRYCVSALLLHGQYVPALEERFLRFRERMQERWGISVEREIKGEHLGKKRGGLGAAESTPFLLRDRHKVYSAAMDYMARTPTIHLFHVVSSRKESALAYNYLFNRIDRTMREFRGHAHVIHDDGQERDVNRFMETAIRENYIPSKYGGWGANREETKHIPLKNIVPYVEHRDSKTCHILQFVDWQSYAFFKFLADAKERAKWGRDARQFPCDELFPRLLPRIYAPACPGNRFHIIVANRSRTKKMPGVHVTRLMLHQFGGNTPRSSK